MKELDFQRELVKAAREQGGQAFKLSHRTLVGVADLYVKLPLLPSTFVECKWGTASLNHYQTKGVRPDLTALQWKFVRDAWNAGGYAGWVMGIPSDGGALVVSGVDEHAFIDMNVNSFFRKRGHQWPVTEVINSLYQQRMARQGIVLKPVSNRGSSTMTSSGTA